MIPRPRIRLPLWAALAIPGAAYVVRSFLLRDGDLSPDLPGDLVVVVVLIAAIILVARARAENADDAQAQARTTDGDPDRQLNDDAADSNDAP